MFFRARLCPVIGGVLALGMSLCAPPHVRATPVVLRPASMDEIIGDRQTDADALGYYASADGPAAFAAVSNPGVIGVGGGTTTKAHGNVVLGFCLPTLSANQTFYTAKLTFEVASRNGNTPNIDVYGLGASNPQFSPATSASTALFLNQNTDATQTKIADNALTASNTAGTLPRTFAVDVTAFVNSLYSGGVPVGGRTEVFFRLNADSALPITSVARVSLTNAASAIALTLTPGDGPAPGTANLTAGTTRTGGTPSILAYDMGTFMPGSNTSDWWRYAGVNGARMFLDPAYFPTMTGDGVTTQAGFVSTKTKVRANPLSTTYFPWPSLYNIFQNTNIGGFQVNYSVGALQGLGVEMLVQINASETTLPITDANDWTGKWKLWKHYYAMAFYLGSTYDVHRFQMYNEPDNPSANGLTSANWLMRLQLASDAVQSALADVNRMYGKSLQALMYAPVTNYPYTSTWDGTAIKNRHINFLGQTDPNYLLVNRLDYHQYGSTPAGFGQAVTDNRTAMQADMPGETPFPESISEFNVATAGSLDLTTDTLDTPVRFSRFGSVAVNVAGGLMDEMWAFKFTQTASSGTNYPVKKNGMHYADVTNFPYTHGGITQTGEAWRLFIHAFAPGRDLLGFSTDGSLGALAILTGRDPVTGRYYIYSANNNTSAVPLAIDCTAWGIPDGEPVTLNEVSAAVNGGIVASSYVAAGRIPTRTQPAYSVWLYTFESRPSQLNADGSTPALTLNASDDAMIKDGGNKYSNFGTSTSVYVKNDASNVAARNVGLLKFNLPLVYLPDIQSATLTMQAATVTVNGSNVQAHVYGIDNDAWTQGAVTWSNAPNVKQGVTPGNQIQNNVVSDGGNTAHIQGQIVVSSTTPATVSVDVTDFVKSRAGRVTSFLLAQDSRWDQNIATGASGDTQPDGMRIVSTEGATPGTPGPQLKLVMLKDTDGDGLSDYAEINVFHTSPTMADTDGDGLSDGAEVLMYGTNPLLADTDGDGVPDGAEIATGTNPLDATSFLRVTKITRSTSSVALEWPSVVGKTYVIQRTATLTAANWQGIGTVSGNGGTQTFSDPAPPTGSTFYRVLVR